MKKILLLVAAVFAASQVSAKVYSFGLSGSQSLALMAGGAENGVFSAKQLGQYDSDTGVLSFVSASVVLEQNANVFGAVIPLTVLGGLTIDFASKTGSFSVSSCQGKQGTKYASGQADAEKAAMACNYVTNGQISSVTIVSPLAPVAPYGDESSLTFTALMTGDNLQASQHFTLGMLGVPSEDVPYFTNEVPVPAAVWLFGSALLGLVGLNRRA